MKVLEIVWPETPYGQPVHGADCVVLLDGKKIANVIEMNILFRADAFPQAMIRAYRCDSPEWPEGVTYDEELQEIVTDTFIVGRDGDGVRLSGDMRLTEKGEGILVYDEGQ